MTSWQPKNFEDHIQLLRQIFQLYRGYGLLINPKKTKLFQKSEDFLSLKLSEEGLLLKEEGTEKIMDWPRPGSSSSEVGTTSQVGKQRELPGNQGSMTATKPIPRDYTHWQTVNLCSEGYPSPCI